MHILLIEDDEKVARFVADGLNGAGHIVALCNHGREGLLRAASELFDVIVVDRMLPVVDGLKIVQTLRGAGDRVPILLLSALGDVDERVRGLRAGADDYLAKPFSLDELLARVEALGRRQAALADNGEPTVLKIADLTIDLVGHLARRGSTRLDLTPREMKILICLARNLGRVVTRSMLLEQVWDYSFDPQTNIIDQHISKLRAKIDRAPWEELIHTVRGTGYVIRAG